MPSSAARSVTLALRFSVLKSVIDEIADTLAHKLVVVPSNPLGIDPNTPTVPPGTPACRCDGRGNV